MEPVIPVATELAIKAGMFTVTVLQINHADLTQLSQQLDEKIQQAPQFFHQSPIIIDLLRLPEATLDLPGLLNLVKTKLLIPIGLRHVPPNLKMTAHTLGLAIFADEKSAIRAKAVPETEVKGQVTANPNRVIAQPIRSGQQIYVPTGDLVILASVGHGAEVLADGNIHIYGPLRGRALAGVKGDSEAIIFCKSLEAELISIAGQYQLSEDLKSSPYWKQAVSIQLKDGRLNIQPV